MMNIFCYSFNALKGPIKYMCESFIQIFCAQIPWPTYITIPKLIKKKLIDKPNYKVIFFISHERVVTSAIMSKLMRYAQFQSKILNMCKLKEENMHLVLNSWIIDVLIFIRYNTHLTIWIWHVLRLCISNFKNVFINLLKLANVHCNPLSLAKRSFEPHWCHVSQHDWLIFQRC